MSKPTYSISQGSVALKATYAAGLPNIRRHMAEVGSIYKVHQRLSRGPSPQWQSLKSMSDHWPGCCFAYLAHVPDISCSAEAQAMYETGPRRCASPP